MADNEGRVLPRLIELRKERTGWVARSTMFCALFGTDTIPTAFTAQATAERVVREIQHRNPGYQVVVVE